MPVTGGTDGVVTVWKPRNRRGEPTQGTVELEPALSVRIHQNAVKCLEIVPLGWREAGSRAYFLVTGGDDNALGLTILNLQSNVHDDQLALEHAPAVSDSKLESRTETTTSTLLIPRAHAAAITAAVILPLSDSRSPTIDHVADSMTQPYQPIMRLRILTASNDQRLKSWNVSIDLRQPGVEGVHVERAGNVYSPVADAAAMALFKLDPEESGHGGGGACTESDAGGGLRVVVCGVGMQVWSSTLR